MSLITEFHVILSHLLIYLHIMLSPHPPAPCTSLSAPHSSPALAHWCPHFQFTFLPSSSTPGHWDSPVLPPLSSPGKAPGDLSSLYKYIPYHILLAANDGIAPCHHQKSGERSIYIYYTYIYAITVTQNNVSCCLLSHLQHGITVSENISKEDWICNCTKWLTYKKTTAFYICIHYISTRVLSASFAREQEGEVDISFCW